MRRNCIDLHETQIGYYLSLVGALKFVQNIVTNGSMK